MANNFKEEPKTAPQPDRWYDLSLGSSFKEDASNKYCALRYEFKPASIDKSKPGALRKNKGNRVSLEFQSNQSVKSKVHFEGSSEDYKENDAVLFFDGHTFRLERLHRAVKQLKHMRQPGECTATAAGGSSGDSRLSPPVGKGIKPPQIGKPAMPSFPVEVERIDVEMPPIPASIYSGKEINDHQIEPPKVGKPSSPKNNDEAKEHCDIDIEDIFGSSSPYGGDDNAMTTEDHNIVVVPADNHAPPQQHENDSDDEIADVDDSGDEEHKGRRINAAEALKAQVNNATGGDDDNRSSSSRSSSGSGSSGSGSGSNSSSSDSEGSDDDVSVTSI
ncbi:unnamed protein product [Linum tenue]|uniref:Transcription elongation factor Eaf N-terminal domain-containing protein n=1 Tax=Linum tenue TaxID=586396 RepID=A0AAV0MX32_9ROSI|nr:unnamed protein product [Linum tenue]